MDRHEKLAIERAERYAPAPKGGAVMAGVCGGVVALLSMIVVSEFYGWRLIQYVWIVAILIAAGFLAGFLGYRRLARLSRKARHVERTRIGPREEREETGNSEEESRPRPRS